MTATVELTAVAVPPTRPAIEAGRHLFDPSRLSGLVRALRWGAIAVVMRAANCSPPNTQVLLAAHLPRVAGRRVAFGGGDS